MPRVSVQAITPEQKKKRIIIQNNIYKLMDKLDLTDAEIKAGKKSYNRQQWEKKFAAMSDFDFHEFMKRMKHERDFNFSYEAESFTKKEKMSVSKIKKVAKDLGVKLMEYVIYPHKNRENPNNPVVSKTPLMIIAISVKRLQQMLAKKNKVSSENTIRNEITDTVTGDDKGGKMSNVQTLSLITTNQYAAVKEFLNVRSDNANAKKEMMKEIEATGKAHLSNYNLKTADMQSVQAMETFLKGAGLRSNILHQNSQSTQALNKRKYSQEEIIEFSQAKKEDYNNYRLLIIGDLFNNEAYSKDINRLIQDFKPEFILHEKGITDTVIDRKLASEYMGKIGEDRTNSVKNLLELTSTLNCKLVGIDLDPEVTNDVDSINDRFALQEANMLQRIQQFYHLEHNPKIVVIVNDAHLRFFPTKEYPNPSAIIKEYKNDSSCLIIRAPQDSREFNKLEDYKITFDKLVQDSTFQSIQSTVYRSQIYMRYLPDTENKEYNIGYLLLEKDAKVFNKENNDFDQILFDNQTISPTFVHINIYKEYEDYNLELPIINALKEGKSKELSNSYLITRKTSKLYNGEPDFAELWSYTAKDQEDKVCIKLN